VRRLTLFPVAALLAASCAGSTSTTTGAVPLELGSDLTVVSVTFDPAAPHAGEPASVAVEWVDLGRDETFPVPVTLDLVLQPDALGLVCSWETAEPYGIVSCDFAGWAEPGSYTWDAWVDTLKVVEEGDEGNNLLSGTIIVGG
jgi:hypothetical protein